MKRISRYWFTALGTLRAILFMARHYRSRVKNIRTLLDSTRLPAASDKAVHARIKQYIPPFLFIEFLLELLRRQPLSGPQVQKAMLLNVLTPLFDDLTDDLHLDENDIRQLLSGEKMPVGAQPALCKALFDKGQFEWNQYWENIVSAQMDSVRQLGGTLNEQQLLQLTEAKGAASVELGWHIIAEEAGGEPMKNMANAFGAFAQILNDIFDIWKDREAGVQTLATHCRDIRHLKSLFIHITHRLSGAIDAGHVPHSGKKQVSAFVVLLYCLGELALERLEQLQLGSRGQFMIDQYTRRELVCDMAKWKNRLRWLVLVLQYQRTP